MKMDFEMTDKQKRAYEWAKNQNYPSVAAQYVKELAGLVDDLQDAIYAQHGYDDYEDGLTEEAKYAINQHADSIIKRLDALLHTDEPECNEPLTSDELQKMDGDKIYIQFIGACRGFYDDEYAPYYGQHEQYIQKYNGMLRACDLPLKYYGELWLAYRHKPAEKNEP